VVDLAFFGANISKIMHGAWFPLLIGVVVFSLMTTWRKGRDLLGKRMIERLMPLEEFLSKIDADPPVRVPGKAVYLAGSPNLAPSALIGCLKHNKMLHKEIAVLTILTADTPRVPRDEKILIETLRPSFYRITARFGFMEEPNAPYVLALVREVGPDFPLEKASFFLGRERLLPAKRSSMPLWRNRVFAFLSRNAQGATSHFKLPPERVIEFGTQVEL
jgi:KUP system potassium uptake protein